MWTSILVCIWVRSTLIYKFRFFWRYFFDFIPLCYFLTLLFTLFLCYVLTLFFDVIFWHYFLTIFKAVLSKWVLDWSTFDLVFNQRSRKMASAPFTFQLFCQKKKQTNTELFKNVRRIWTRNFCQLKLLNKINLALRNLST